MITVAILLNGQPIMARSAINTGKRELRGPAGKRRTLYSVDDGSTVAHDPDEGAVRLAIRLLETIKEPKDSPMNSPADQYTDETRLDWTRKCENCGQSPIVPITGLCEPCTFAVEREGTERERADRAEAELAESELRCESLRGSLAEVQANLEDAEKSLAEVQERP